MRRMIFQGSDFGNVRHISAEGAACTDGAATPKNKATIDTMAVAFLILFIFKAVKWVLMWPLSSHSSLYSHLKMKFS